jgi:hypothetical protein
LRGQPAISPTPVEPVILCGSNDVKMMPKQQEQEPIIVTKCLFNQCTGQYTDALTQSLKIVCSDPKHLPLTVLEQEDKN